MSIIVSVDSGEIEIDLGNFVYAEKKDPLTGTITDAVYLDWSETPQDEMESLEAEGRRIFDKIAAAILDR